MKYLINVFGAVSLIFIPILLILTAPPALTSTQPVTITVSAAASLTDVFKDIAADFEKRNPGVNVELNLASSGSLRLQIEAGAQIDVFASASQKHMDILAGNGLIFNKSRQDFAGNSLVLVTQKNRTINKIDDLRDENVERIAIGNPETSPVGRYARQSLMEAGLWDRVKDKVIFAENVKQVLTYVERGEVDAGFVYMTDVDGVQPGSIDVVCTVPVSIPILYPAAVVSSSSNKVAAEEFNNFLTGENGRRILKNNGFWLPDQDVV
ncbi:MAG: molybdate ABC transporter substrate-binding protein [Methanosarcinales archaeon]|nr:molybdate ABC transporter substrate-binding protein [Methanosarcinales archaeon]